MTIAPAMTMKVLVFSLFLLFGMSDACIEVECNELNPIGDFLELGFLPNGEQLLNLCPKTLQFFECANRNIKECQGKTFEELAYVNDCKDESCVTARVALVYLTFDKVTKEICNRSSALHQGYMDNIDCIKNVLRNHDNCDGIITGADEKISEVLNNIENEHELSIRKRCLEAAVARACFTVQVDKACGEVARTTSVAFLRSLKPLVLSEGCYELDDDVADSKAKLLDDLDLNESLKNKFKDAFDLA